MADARVNLKDSFDRAVAARPGLRETGLARAREDAATWEGMFRNEVSDEILVNTLSTYLDCTPLEKQFLLEAEGLHQRARRLNDLIQFMLHDQHGAKGWG